MLTAAQIENTLKQVKPILEQKYFVSKIGYFGSFSKGTQTEESDIDLLVEFKKPLGWAFFDLQFFLESQFKRKVDLTTATAIKEQLKNKILSQVKYI
ncbi:MAG: nucleotidyltransferase family protein [Bacteroidia bacterium]